MLARGFGPGFNGPLSITVVMGGADPAGALARLEAAVKASAGVTTVTPAHSIPRPGGPALAIFEAYPASAPQDTATSALIVHLRTDVIPPAVAGSGLQVYVGGETAIFDDFASVLTSKLPLFIGVVVGLSFILLSVVFRSLLIPLKAAVMNLLSVGAAFGVLVAVFQWGWLGSVFGLGQGLFAGTVLVNVLLPLVHPRMGSPLSDSTTVALLESPGFMARNYGVQTPVVSLAAHVAYGTVIALFMTLAA